MKKIIYGITILCLMFVGTISVYAATDEHIKLSESTLSIVEGGNGTFNIMVTDTYARGYILSSDSDVVKVNTTAYTSSDDTGHLHNDGFWTSKMGGAGSSPVEYPITLSAVGKEGNKATVTVEIYDATVFSDRKAIATPEKKLTYTVEVTIVKSDEPIATEYTITYDANDGKDAPAAQTKKAGEDLNLAIAKPTKEGYEFIGWNTQKDGKGKSYEAGGKYTEDANLTLYAMWKAKNVKDNPNTGDTMIYVVLLLTLGALIYSYWYMKKSQEN